MILFMVYIYRGTGRFSRTIFDVALFISIAQPPSPAAPIRQPAIPVAPRGSPTIYHGPMHLSTYTLSRDT